MKIVAATHNKGKMLELKSILDKTGLELVSWDDAGLGDFEIEENSDTCEGNSLIKAETVCKLTGMPALGDDTGLFVDAAGGQPGVQAARYAGVHGDDAANRKKLLTVLKDVPEDKRTAEFVTVITIVWPDGRKIAARGECRGHISVSERGDRGFGYDSLFIPDGSDKTFAELPVEFKNSISHRRKALEKLSLMLCNFDI